LTPDTSQFRSLPAEQAVSDLARPISERARSSEQSGVSDVARPIPVFREWGSEETRTSSPQTEDLLHRTMNVSIAVVSLALLSPLLIVFAAIVKLTSPGPIFYSQPRVGIDRRRTGNGATYDRRGRDLGGRPFMIYKFRTMRINAEAPSGAVWATKGDARVTAVGGFMRKYRIDEIPQLINVIRGEMNIVGPRPERPSIFSTLCDDIAEYPLRQRAKPGITGWAQVNQGYDTNLDDVRNKVRYDLEYLSRQGIAEDLRIMAKTLPVMILRKGGW
jgi:lipopolysaccharide/colanic/teichoic acid biosynthesis glycosyltransferase